MQYGVKNNSLFLIAMVNRSIGSSIRKESSGSMGLYTHLLPKHGI